MHRLLDANLDRAREGLRVLEDWARFGLDRADLVARCKHLRQRLGSCHADRFKLARHTATDPATGMGHPAQAERLSPGQILAANAGRAQEALRVIEEFARSGEPQLPTANASRPLPAPLPVVLPDLRAAPAPPRLTASSRRLAPMPRRCYPTGMALTSLPFETAA